MISWQDSGLLLSIRPYGETKKILSFLTERHGRHVGLAQARISKKTGLALIPGNVFDVCWQAKQEGQLGTFKVELIKDCFGHLLGSAAKLAAVQQITALCHMALPEGHQYPRLYGELGRFFQSLPTENWVQDYAKLEVILLEEMGFGLDTRRCAVTHTPENLKWISPKTGRAVCEAAGAEYADKLLPYSPIFKDDEKQHSQADIQSALYVTGFFLKKHFSDFPNIVNLLQKRESWYWSLYDKK